MRYVPTRGPNPSCRHVNWRACLPTASATKAMFDRTTAVQPTAAEEFVPMREPSRVLA